MENKPERSGREDRTDLNCLLARLDSDPANAWEKYNSLRTRLVRFFDWNRSGSSEEMADEVLDRVARKPQDEEIRDIHEYVIGVARNIRLEAYKKSQRESHLEDRPGGSEALAGSLDLEKEMVADLDLQKNLACLRECLGTLRPADRALAIDYYSAEEEKQKVHRQRLASVAGITMVALRVRANRLREKLEQCVKNCVASPRAMSGRGVPASSYPAD
jgi:hypothetical protein